MTDFDSVARQSLLDNGFVIDLDAASRRELDSLLPVELGPNLCDLRHLLWSSIDNEESKDLDQVEYAEELPDGAVRLRIGIADVDELVPRGSALDRHAMSNSTSVYTGISVFPMLPPAISTDLTSLNQGVDRAVVVAELTIERDGSVRSRDVYRAYAANRAKLAYDSTGAWLEGKGQAPSLVTSTPGLEAQLRLQDRVATLLKTQRVLAGALDFETTEATAKGKNGVVDSIVVTNKNRARDLIEDFMIAANVAIAKFMAGHLRAGIRRVVREPKRWPRIVEIAAGHGVELPATPNAKSLAEFLSARRAAEPALHADLSLSVVKLLGPGEYVVDRPGGEDDQGHFGLAADDYSHATAPNRRYSDLVTQRLVKAALANAPEPYTIAELEEIAAHCTERENAANRAERTTRKAAAAILLADRIGESFDAVVTGVKKEGTYVRLHSPPAEGRVVTGEKGMDVGERVRVTLLRTDAAKGHIDFAGDATSRSSTGR